MPGFVYGDYNSFKPSTPRRLLPPLTGGETEAQLARCYDLPPKQGYESSKSVLSLILSCLFSV